MKNGPFDFYLQAWLAGCATGLPFEVVRISPSPRKCWAVFFTGAAA